MKRLQIGKVLTELDGTPMKTLDSEDGALMDLTLKDILLQTFKTAIDVSTADATILWFKVGPLLVACEEEYLELEDALFDKLKNAYLSPKALQGAFLWVKAHIQMAFDEAEDVPLDAKKKKE